MSELKPCPFCGEQVFTPLVSSLDDGYTRCISCGAKMQRSRWQSRPIEDELRKRIAELEAALINARELIGMTPQPAFPAWIPVSEGTKGLEILEDYLTTDESGEISKMKYCGVLRGVQKWLRSDNAFYHPTHWMPLPQPPEVKQ